MEALIKKRNRFKRRRKVSIESLTRFSFLPSIFTLSSLLLGYLAILQIFKSNYIAAVFLIGGSVILDGFDGTVARLTKTESNFGVQLDSLVDAVSFGLVTSLLIYKWGFEAINSPIGKVAGFIFLTAGIIRLARFNVLKEAHAFPSNVFVGMPIPLGALSITSAVLMLKGSLTTEFEMWIFFVYVVFISFLMVSTIKYRTMKRIDTKYNLLILLCIAITVASCIIYPRVVIPGVTGLYLVSPIFFLIFEKLRKPTNIIQPLVPIEKNPEEKSPEK